jgi:hypothetical protein
MEPMHKKISSEGAAASAKIFACLPLPLFAAMLAAAFWNGQIGAGMVAAGLFFLGGYFWSIRRFVWSMVDEVTDCGDYLLAKRGDVEARIVLRDIEDVIDRPYGRPPKTIVKLGVESAFGRRLVFVPKAEGIGADLRHRVRIAAPVSR